MRRIRKFFVFIIAVIVFGSFGITGWLIFSPPDLLLVATGYAAQMVCANVFIAKRDADAVIATDVKFALSDAVKRMRINVDTGRQRVEVAYMGLFARRRARYEEGRGCTLDSTEGVGSRAAAISLPPKHQMRSGRRATGWNCQTTNVYWLC